MSLPRVVLLPRKARPFYGQHPWVYAGAVARVEGEPADGAEVDLVSHGDHFVARGLYNHRSKIRVRLYSWQVDVALDRNFFRERLASAIQLRHDVLGLGGPGRACSPVARWINTIAGSCCNSPRSAWRSAASG
jgi:23S rRNA (cytosine1962-C5)-methyltransferase